MPFIKLTEFTIFDKTEGEGIVLDRKSGRYLGLNATATLMLEASLQYETQDKVIEFLHNFIDADDATLIEGIESLRNDLLALNVINKY